MGIPPVKRICKYDGIISLIATGKNLRQETEDYRLEMALSLCVFKHGKGLNKEYRTQANKVEVFFSEGGVKIELILHIELKLDSSDEKIVLGGIYLFYS
jgi:hypothetical protein